MPVFESESLRRNLGERLTEAVIKEIELRTPYKVSSSFDADSVLSGRITRETKRVLAQNQFSDARLYETEFIVECALGEPPGRDLDATLRDSAAAIDHQR